MSTTEDYRARGRECEVLARQTRDPGISRQLLDLARQWRALAEQAEARDRASRPHPDGA